MTRNVRYCFLGLLIALASCASGQTLPQNPGPIASSAAINDEVELTDNVSSADGQATPGSHAALPPVVADPSVAIGWSELPVDPPYEARRRNREALKAHGRGDYVASERIFREVSSAHPSYVLARFNHACALTRLGQHQEAAEDLIELMTLDYPSIVSRLEHDEDIALLRKTPDWAAVDEVRNMLRHPWAKAMREGVALIHQTEEVGDRTVARRTAQAGVWLPSRRRFVPAAPRVASPRGGGRGHPPLAAVIFDQALGRVVTATGLARLAEGADIIDNLVITAWAAGEGTQLYKTNPPRRDSTAFKSCWMMSRKLHATKTGLALSLSDHDCKRVLTSGEGETYDETTLPRMHVTQDGAFVRLSPPRSDITVHRRKVSATIDGRQIEITLHAAHAAREDLYRRKTIVVPLDGAKVWIMTADTDALGYDTWPGNVALSRVDLHRGTAELVRRGEGPGALIAGPDGSVYAQINTELILIRSDGEPETLPAGLVLVASGI